MVFLPCLISLPRPHCVHLLSVTLCVYKVHVFPGPVPVCLVVSTESQYFTCLVIVSGLFSLASILTVLVLLMLCAFHVLIPPWSDFQFGTFLTVLFHMRAILC